MAGTSRKLTIYDIAKLSGASPSTVSAVLSGKGSVRRIKDATVENIEKIAREQGYAINLQARGLRQARSRLAGMIIPMHDNRFFSSLSQSFDLIARERGLCPVIASTLRDPKEEIRIVEMLLSYAIDSLFIAGATDPDALAHLCRAASLPHIFIDLPSSHSPSVVTNNFHGAELLARKILAESKPAGEGPRGKSYFFGGSLSDYATARRAAAFRAVAEERGDTIGEDQIVQCRYAPRSAAIAIEALCRRLDGLPAALFVNSITVFEGVMSYFVNLPPAAFENCVIGCFDYDPFAAFLQFPVTMVRQNSNQLIEQAYAMLDQGSLAPRLVEIEPDLILPRTIHSNALNNLG